MIDISVVMAQIKEHVATSPDLQDVVVTRSEPLNENAGTARGGWIGLYRRSASYEAGNLGHSDVGENYEGNLTFLVVAQKVNMLSGEASEDDLEQFVKTIVERVLSLPKTYVDHFPEFEVEYGYTETDRKTMYFQTALITFVAEFST